MNQAGVSVMRVAIYCRVSTDEQTLENQTMILKKWASDRGWEVGEIYYDTGSAFQHTDQKALKELLAACGRGTYKQVLVYDLSRLTRKGPLELMLLLKQFADKGAPVYSYLEEGINVPSDFQPILIAMYGTMARIFSTTLSARTKAGMARAKAAGKHIGRPRKVRTQINEEDKKNTKKLESLKTRAEKLIKQIEEIEVVKKGIETT